MSAKSAIDRYPRVAPDSIAPRTEPAVAVTARLQRLIDTIQELRSVQSVRHEPGPDQVDCWRDRDYVYLEAELESNGIFADMCINDGKLFVRILR